MWITKTSNDSIRPNVNLLRENENIQTSFVNSKVETAQGGSPDGAGEDDADGADIVSRLVITRIFSHPEDRIFFICQTFLPEDVKVSAVEVRGEPPFQHDDDDDDCLCQVTTLNMWRSTPCSVFFSDEGRD